jgi:hypothetical protein
MPTHDQERLQAIWRGQSVPALAMTTEQLRARAAQFNSEIRRRNLRDYLSHALIAAIMGVGVLVIPASSRPPWGVLVGVGSALTMLWSLLSMYWLHRFGAVAPAPAESNAQTCAAYHKVQLERQRDIALSWPWGIALGFPGFVLLCIGLGLGSQHPNWVFPAVTIGLLFFMYVAVVIHGKVLAGQWQREIDSIQDLKGEPR